MKKLLIFISFVLLPFLNFAQNDIQRIHRTAKPIVKPIQETADTSGDKHENPLQPSLHDFCVEAYASCSLISGDGSRCPVIYGLPEDLPSSRLAIVNFTTIGSAQFAGTYNRQMKKKMKRYPFEFEIYKGVGNIENCDYRLFLRRYETVVRKEMQKKDSFSGRYYSTERNIIVYRYYVELFNLKTHEIYRVNGDPMQYNYAIKYFVNKAIELTGEE